MTMMGESGAAVPDDLEPLVDRSVVFPAIFEDQEIQATGGEKVPMRSAHHLLPTEVPDVQADAAIVGRPGRRLNSLPGHDPLRLRLAGIARLVADEVSKERCLADRLAADHEELGLVEGQKRLRGIGAPKAPVRGENRLRIRRVLQGFSGKQVTEVPVRPQVQRSKSAGIGRLRPGPQNGLGSGLAGAVAAEIEGG